MFVAATTTFVGVPTGLKFNATTNAKNRPSAAQTGLDCLQRGIATGILAGKCVNKSLKTGTTGN